jgi:hypothetical protein
VRERKNTKKSKAELDSRRGVIRRKNDWQQTPLGPAKLGVCRLGTNPFVFLCIQSEKLYALDSMARFGKGGGGGGFISKIFN